MNDTNRLIVSLAAVSTLVAGAFTQPVKADLEAVAVLAIQPQVSVDTELSEHSADKETLALEFAAQLKPQLSERLADEFAKARRSAELADEFSDQIIDALNERLPDEVGNLIAAAD